MSNNLKIYDYSTQQYLSTNTPQGRQLVKQYIRSYKFLTKQKKYQSAGSPLEYSYINDFGKSIITDIHGHGMNNNPVFNNNMKPTEGGDQCVNTSSEMITPKE